MLCLRIAVKEWLKLFHITCQRTQGAFKNMSITRQQVDSVHQEHRLNMLLYVYINILKYSSLSFLIFHLFQFMKSMHHHTIFTFHNSIRFYSSLISNKVLLYLHQSVLCFNDNQTIPFDVHIRTHFQHIANSNRLASLNFNL